MYRFKKTIFKGLLISFFGLLPSITLSECWYSYSERYVDPDKPCLSPGCTRATTGQGRCTCQYFYDTTQQRLLTDPQYPESYVNWDSSVCPITNPCCQSQACCPNCGHAVGEHVYLRNSPEQ